MNLTIQIIIFSFVVMVISAILYKLGFRFTDITFNIWPFRLGIKRKPNSEKDHLPEKTSYSIAESQKTDAKQKALNGGKIEGSTIKSSANSGANLSQESRGENSKITDSHIEIK